MADRTVESHLHGALALLEACSEADLERYAAPIAA